jgi:hypothetical protein
MPLFVQHVATREVNHLDSKAYSLPSVTSSTTGETLSSAKCAILAPSKGKDPYRVSLQQAELSITEQDTSTTLVDREVQSTVAVAEGQIVVPFVTAAIDKSPMSQNLFIFGGQRRANEHDIFGCSADLALVNAKTGSCLTLSKPSSELLSEIISTTTTSGQHHVYDESTLVWPSARKYASACCIYNAREPIVVNTDPSSNTAALANQSVAPVAAPVPVPTGKDSKAVDKGKGKEPVKDPKKAEEEAAAAAAAAEAIRLAEMLAEEARKKSEASPLIVVFGGMNENGTVLGDMFTFLLDPLLIDATSVFFLHHSTKHHKKNKEAQESSHSVPVSASASAIITEGIEDQHHNVSGQTLSGASASHLEHEEHKDHGPPVPSRQLWRHVTRKENSSPWPGARAHHSMSATASGDRFIIFGGYGFSTVEEETSHKQPHLLQDCWVLNCLNWQWTQIRTSGPAPSPRCRHAAVCNAFLGDEQLIAENKIIVGYDVRPILAIYDRVDHIIKKKAEESKHAAEAAAEAAAAKALAAAEEEKNTKGKKGSKASEPEPVHISHPQQTLSSLPDFLSDGVYNPAGVDVLFIFGGMCSPDELASSQADALRDAGSHAASALVNKVSSRPDDMMDGTVYALVIDPNLAAALEDLDNEKQTKDSSVSSKSSSTSHEITLGGWTTIPALTLSMIEGAANVKNEYIKENDLMASLTRGGGSQLDRSSIGSIGSIEETKEGEFKSQSPLLGIDVGGSVVSTLNLMTASTSDITSSIYEDRSQTPHRPSTTRPSSRTVRPSYKVQMHKKRNDTYLRRYNHVASAMVLRRDGITPSYYFFLFGGVTDVHMRSQAQRLIRRAPGPLDDPLISGTFAVGLTLELLSADSMKTRYSAPASLQHDGYGGLVLKPRHHDPSRGVWSLEVVRRVYDEEDGTYEGESDAGVRIGKGSMSWRSGPYSHYQGSWLHDLPDGFGKMIFRDQTVYEGEWKSGRQQGHGSCTWTEIIAPIAPNSNNGGISPLPSIRSISLYDSNHKSLSESFFSPFSRVELSNFVVTTYKGDWKDNMPCGQGVATFTNGAIYTGEFTRGRITGRGELVCSYGHDGASEETEDSPLLRVHGQINLSIVGDWVDGVYHDLKGLWRKESARTGEVEFYSGPFVDGYRHGENAVAELSDGSHYEGPYRFGKRNGIGMCRYATKDIFQGKFVGDLRNGKGSLRRYNGDVHVGNWKNDLMEGPGVLQKGTGSTEIHGVWKEGVLIAEEPNTARIIHDSPKTPSSPEK